MKKGAMFIYESKLDLYGPLTKTRTILDDYQIMLCLSRTLAIVQRRSFNSDSRIVDSIDLVKYIEGVAWNKSESKHHKVHDRVFHDISIELTNVGTNIISELSMSDRRLTGIGGVVSSSLGLLLPLTIIEYSNNFMLEEFKEYLEDLERNGEVIHTEIKRLMREFESNGELFLSHFYGTEGNVR